MTTEQRQLREAEEWVTEALRRTIADLMPHQPRFRYWTCRVCKTDFLYTTEKFADGKYGSAILVPYGPGSRSGKPDRWHPSREVHVKVRKLAKARAYELFKQHQATAHR